MPKAVKQATTLPASIAALTNVQSHPDYWLVSLIEQASAIRDAAKPQKSGEDFNRWWIRNRLNYWQGIDSTIHGARAKTLFGARAKAAYVLRDKCRHMVGNPAGFTRAEEIIANALDDLFRFTGDMDRETFRASGGGAEEVLA